MVDDDAENNQAADAIQYTKDADDLADQVLHDSTPRAATS